MSCCSLKILLAFLLLPCTILRIANASRRTTSRNNHRGWMQHNNHRHYDIRLPPHVSPRTHYYDPRYLRGGSDVEPLKLPPSARTATATNSGTNAPRYLVSMCSVQGGRSYMEDDVFVNQFGTFAAVFDGHGGKAVSRYLRQNLYANLQAALPLLQSKQDKKKSESLEEPTSEVLTDGESTYIPSSSSSFPTVADYQEALRLALDKVDREVQRISHWSFQGSTAAAVWIHEPSISASMASSSSLNPEDEPYDNGESRRQHQPTPSQQPSAQRTLVVANVGDSRAVLCRAYGLAVDLTHDHKPNVSEERRRIESRGGTVVWCGDVDDDDQPIPNSGIYRVNGNLALSRAIGDRSERPAVTAEPDVRAVPLAETDEFVVISTDGLWDVMSSQQVVSFIRRNLQEHAAIEDDVSIRAKIADMVVAEALRRGTTDNVSVVVVWLNPSTSN